MVYVWVRTSILIVPFVLVVFGSMAAAGSAKKNSDKISPCSYLLADNIRTSKAPDLEYQGLTAEGLKLVEKVAEDFQWTERAFNTTIIGQESIFQVNMMTVLSKQNHLFLGPKGAAKSMGTRFLFPEIWGIQINEWTTPDKIFGGQTKEALEQGLARINTSRSALEAKIVQLDEINNANPALNGSIMSFLNPEERFYLIMGVPYPAETISVFSTGNATRAELLESFIERQLQSGPAVLGRFLFQSLAHNWLDKEQRLHLDKLHLRKTRLKHFKESGDEAQKAYAIQELAKLEAREIDFALVRTLADLAFEISPILNIELDQVIDELRRRLNHEAKRSEEALLVDPKEIKYEPKADWDTRIRSVAMSIIKYSAALDLLRLPKEVRRDLLKKPIHLSAASLWRIVDVAITNFVGIRFFDLPNAQMRFNVVDKSVNGTPAGEILLSELNLDQIATESRTLLAAGEFTNLKKEQDTFNEVISTALKNLAKGNAEIAAILTIAKDPDLDGPPDFENLVYGHLWRKYALALNSKTADANTDSKTPVEESKPKKKKK